MFKSLLFLPAGLWLERGTSTYLILIFILVPVHFWILRLIPSTTSRRHTFACHHHINRRESSTYVHHSYNDLYGIQQAYCIIQNNSAREMVLIMKKAKQLVLLFLICVVSGSEAFVRNQHPSTSPLQKQHDKLIHGRAQTYESSQLTRRELSLSPIIESASSLGQSLFRYNGQVPLSQSVGLNFVLFALFRSKLLRMLTPEGFVHACALGTGLWAALGWRGWTMCVAYLFLGSAVTKVRFAEKEKRGIAESRGGRRGPENVW
jgi:hypothetical protein